MRWDVFCRVVDNYGDAGVCWRLAAQLASRGESVRLWIDDPSPLAFMAPQGAPGVTVVHWTDATSACDPGEVVVEAFGCDPPPAFVERMAASRSAPVWINLEYLSAEEFCERSHGLPSPQRSGLVKWFFYPGFSGRSGGLLREPGLQQAQGSFDRSGWLAAHGLQPRASERLVSLFCYDNPALPGLLDLLARQPTLLIAMPGPAQSLARPRGALRVRPLPLLTQPGYDRLLWACDVNVVRGEDSFVRAQWAPERPFLWQIYPQHDGVHRGKLDAFLDRLQPGDAVRRLFLAFNGLGPYPEAWPDAGQWRLGEWRASLLRQSDLAQRLMDFALLKRASKLQ